MDSLKQYLKIQRTENETVKNEIMTKLDELLHPLDVPMNKCNIKSTKYSNYISDLCQLEQKINHKLTEINYDLKKFKIQNKCPECDPSLMKNSRSDDFLDNIETLKAYSNRLISKLDKLREKHNENTDNQLIHVKKTENKSSMCVKKISHKDQDSLIDFDSSYSCEGDICGELVDGPTVQELCDNELCEDKDKRGISFDLLNSTPICKDKENKDILASQGSHPELENEFIINSSSTEEHKDYKFVDILSQDIKMIDTSVSKPGVEVKMEYDLKNELIALEDIPVTQKDISIDEPLLANSSQYQDLIQNINDIIVKPAPDDNKKMESQDARSNLSDVMWKNINELDSTLPKNSIVSENIETSLSNSPRSYEASAKPCDVNISDEKKIEFDEKLFNLLELESGPSSYYDSESDSGVLPSSDSSLGIKEKCISGLVENQNLCDSSKENYYKLIKKEDNKNKLFERLENEKPSEKDSDERNKEKLIYEIPGSDIPTYGMGCVFSHVESPSEFYIHLDTEESKLIDSLNDMITEHYKNTKIHYRSKEEASRALGTFCCAYVKDDNMFYRAEIINWFFEETTKHVLIQLVDYGNDVLVPLKYLRPLTEEFSLLPRLAVKCYFPFLYPPGSTKNNLLIEWPNSTTEALFDLSGLGLENNKAIFKISHVQVEKHQIGIDMYQVNGQNDIMIGQLLIDLGHAVEIILPEDDPMGILSDEEEIENLENCDNLNEVVIGYDPKDEARICKFTKHDGAKCFKRSCKLEHAKFSRGGYTTDQTLTYADALNDLKLPKPGDRISIRFTTFLEATRYFINLTRYAEDIRELERTINLPSNCNNFEPFKVFPAFGEIVLVKHWQKRWLRAKVRHHLFNDKGKCTGVQVFIVDYGDIIDVPLAYVRQIKAEYLNLPFQAIECILHGYKDSGNFERKDIDRFFYENLVFRNFKAEIKAVSDMQLRVNLFYKDRNLGDILKEYGFLAEVDEGVPMPHPKSVIIPG
ncbi:uncharacterized protein LOC123683306 isoform X2 [Harmonia axyridis]|uniref:uncharacterized protein LOC123683306 isoform X2 n=1 Tax=Harmonia axyridis TaxID=115357 RepID=UPI001E2781A8|nr:uncharacterized protein LOC123683306 isoform X2 [Harmonia axyridis]